MSEHSPGVPLSSLDKAIDLLFHLHEVGAPCGVTAISRALEMPKSSVHRLLQTLGRRRLLEQGGDGRYGVGPALVALGIGALERDPVVAIARPVLETEAAALGETVFLTAPRAGEIQVLAKAEGEGFLRAAPRVGASVPLHATAVGKLALAFAPDRFPLASALEGFTGRTVTSPAVLRSEVERVRARGWAENHGEWIDGLSVVAAAVRNGGVLVGMVAVAAPTPRLVAIGVDEAARHALSAAALVSRELSGSDLAARAAA